MAVWGINVNTLELFLFWIPYAFETISNLISKSDLFSISKNFDIWSSRTQPPIKNSPFSSEIFTLGLTPYPFNLQDTQVVSDFILTIDSKFY